MTKVVLITGANGGIGAATCSMFQKQGHTVIGLDVGQQKSGDWEHVSCDLSDSKMIESVFAEIHREHDAIDILVNNAAVFQPRRFFDISPGDFEQTMRVNVEAVFLTSKLMSARLIERRRPGAIVNIASMAGIGGGAYTDYGTSKGAVMVLTKSMARDLGPRGIRVNAVAPGLIETGMMRSNPSTLTEKLLERTPLGRVGKPEEIANAIEFLASERASYVHGAIVEVCGGFQ
ncbi:SDR family NAD(P)-dependent oxidoreductase [Cupriavidus numazuensis]|uniref:3-oxoacyl-[acyl-carrier-protein] reductase FabG n=1 Tax=Cupriavidus numazuensis TaxID=221992 RepID=A0ABM8TLG4_9BURK|nr:SDR family NAD(P)-dependent oxidoreductase [Cupriavidus numazuensis]CAG2153413.1 3-oxoacyl-[acyl-carrier-protein] reductase FabG [Cupriavidus numazuensis]